MSWITDIAGKAEELLNKIDQNAAVVLKKEKGSGRVREKSNKKRDTDYERKPHDDPEKLSTSYSLKLSQLSPAMASSTSYNQYPDLLDSARNHDDSQPLEQSQSEKQLLLDKSNITEDVRELVNENLMLKNEIRTLNNEVSLLMNRIKESDKGTSNLEEKFNKSEAETVVLNQELNEISSKLSKAEYQCSLLQSENERFRSLASDSENSKVLKLQQEISELQLKSQRQEEVLLNNITCLERRLGMSESRLAESESERKKALEELRVELDQYRNKTHQQALEIDRYRGAISDHSDQLMREDVAAECSRLRDELEGSRMEVRHAEERLESTKREMLSQQLELITFTDRAISAEHQQKALRQELDSVRRDLMDKVSQLGDDLKDRENELRQARSELVARRSQDTWQSRVTNLTSALVRKQAALEQASTEAAQLRLQLERTKSKCREYSQQIQISRHVNDTDDVKAQVPNMFAHSPFDGGLTRHMKQIYSVMDSVATRITAMLLRRYPIARIIVLIYMILLHSIVCLILYYWTPDSK